MNFIISLSGVACGLLSLIWGCFIAWSVVETEKVHPISRIVVFVIGMMFISIGLTTVFSSLHPFLEMLPQ